MWVLIWWRRDLSERLNLSRDEGEKWIVNLIRETRMGADAKIDLEKVFVTAKTSDVQILIVINQNVISINRPPLPIYQTVIEKTRGLAFRTQALGAAMARSGSGNNNNNNTANTGPTAAEQPAAVEARG